MIVVVSRRRSLAGFLRRFDLFTILAMLLSTLVFASCQQPRERIEERQRSDSRRDQQNGRPDAGSKGCPSTKDTNQRAITDRIEEGMKADELEYKQRYQQRLPQDIRLDKPGWIEPRSNVPKSDQSPSATKVEPPQPSGRAGRDR